MVKSDEANAHDLAHELRDTIFATLNAFVAFQLERGIELSPAMILLALEMEASRVRRHCRALGITKDQIREIQGAASSCARVIYEADMETALAPEDVDTDHNAN